MNFADIFTLTLLTYWNFILEFIEKSKCNVFSTRTIFTYYGHDACIGKCDDEGLKVKRREYVLNTGIELFIR